MTGIVFSHKWIKRRDSVAGVGHLLIFYGFLVLFLGTTILGIDTDFTRPVFHWNFWQGGFYLVYKLALDIAGVMLLAGLGSMAYNRAVRRPARLEYRRPDRSPGEYDRSLYRAGDWVFVGTLGVLALSGLLLEGFWLAQSNQHFADWSPVGWVLMKLFRGDGSHRVVGRAGPSRHVVVPRPRGAVLRRLHPFHEGSPHAGQPGQRRRP